MKKLSIEYVLVICYIIVLAVAVTILSSCNTPKATQRKDDKAVARVLADDDLMARVGRRLAPCVNDTTIISDTTIVHEVDVVYDTATITDTVTGVVTKVVTKTKVLERVKYVTKHVADLRAALAWRDSTDKYRAEVLALRASPKKKGIPAWTYVLVGTILVAVLAVAALRKVVPWMAVVKAVTMLVTAFRKKK